MTSLWRNLEITPTCRILLGTGPTLLIPRPVKFHRFLQRMEGTILRLSPSNLHFPIQTAQLFLLSSWLVCQDPFCHNGSSRINSFSLSIFGPRNLVGPAYDCHSQPPQRFSAYYRFAGWTPGCLGLSGCCPTADHRHRTTNTLYLCPPIIQGCCFRCCISAGEKIRKWLCWCVLQPRLLSDYSHSQGITRWKCCHPARLTHLCRRYYQVGGNTSDRQGSIPDRPLPFSQRRLANSHSKSQSLCRYDLVTLFRIRQIRLA